MESFKKKLFLGVIFSVLTLLPTLGWAKWDILSDQEKMLRETIMNHWETWVPARQADGSAPMMTFDELYDGLTSEQMAFLERIRNINPQTEFNFQGDHLGESREGVSFVTLNDQWILKNGEHQKLDPQYLPENVYAAYEEMMQAMKLDLGKRLWVESGYRSPAYQLYQFVFYLSNHEYSLVETGHWVALPGYSEHGAPHKQAIDFINEEGINGEDRVEDFEMLPEYEWLQKNAEKFGFELSYPRNQPGITFEPWHWRHIQASNDS